MSKPIHEELLSAYLDGELTSREKVEVERALDADLTLRERLAELREVSRQLQQLPQLTAPLELHQSVMQQISSVAPQPASASSAPSQSSQPQSRILRSRWGVMAGWGAAAAVASLLVVVGTWPSHPANESGPLLTSEHTLANHDTATFAAPAHEGNDVSSLMIAEVAPSLDSIAPSAGANDQLQADKTEVAPPVQVVCLSREEIQNRIRSLDQLPAVNNSFKVPARLKNENGETPIVVVFTVVDVEQAANQMQFLLQQQIRSQNNQQLPLNYTRSNDSKLTAVTLELEMDGRDMAQVFNNIEAYDAVVYVEEGSGPLANFSAESEEARKETGHRPPVGGTAGPSAPNRERGQANGVSNKDNEAQLAATANHRKQQADLAASRSSRAKPPETTPLQQLQNFDFRQLALPDRLAAKPHEIPPKPAVAKTQSASPSAPEIADSASAEADGRRQITKPDSTSSRLMRAAEPRSSEKTLPAATGASAKAWEDARRLRAYVLFRQQTPNVQNAPDESSGQ